VEGFSWDVVRVLATRFSLPPLLLSDLLAVEHNEDVLEVRHLGGKGGRASQDRGDPDGGEGPPSAMFAHAACQPLGPPRRTS
jgi:hypothetical protein